MEKYIVVLGDINADITASAERLPKVGETVNGTEVHTYPGGKGANQADQCAKLGVKTYMIGRAGTDLQGMSVLQSLREDGIDCQYVQAVAGETTGCAIINIDDEGKNMIVYVPGANIRFKKEDIDKAEELIKNASVFITQSGINQDVMLYALEMAHKAGVPTIFNPAPASSVPLEAFQYAEYVTPNETESELFTGILQKDYSPEEWRRKSAKWFMEHGVKRVCITLGSDGVYYADEEKEMVVPAFKISALDTTAAGDSFHGGLAYGLVQEYPLDLALRIGCACGAVTSTGKGAQVSIEHLNFIKAFMEKNGVTF